MIELDVDKGSIHFKKPLTLSDFSKAMSHFNKAYKLLFSKDCSYKQLLTSWLPATTLSLRRELKRALRNELNNMVSNYVLGHDNRCLVGCPHYQRAADIYSRCLSYYNSSYSYSRSFYSLCLGLL